MRNKEFVVERRESRGFIWNIIPPLNNSYSRAMPQNPPSSTVYYGRRPITTSSFFLFPSEIPNGAPVRGEVAS